MRLYKCIGAIWGSVVHGAGLEMCQESPLSARRCTVLHRTSTLLVVLLGACSAQSWQVKEIENGGSYRYRQEDLNYSALRDKVESSERTRVDSKWKVTRISNAPGSKIYLFTDPGHPAHPAVIILKSSDSHAVPFTGHCGGDIAACESWLIDVGRTKGSICEPDTPKAGNDA
jgi:hypothetical protein